MICETCGQGIVLKNPRNFKNPDVIKLVAIMKKNNLSLKEMRELLEISPRTLMRWLSVPDNRKIVKPVYFTVLKMKGFEE